MVAEHQPVEASRPDPVKAAYERCAQIAESYSFSPCIGMGIAELIREAGKEPFTQNTGSTICSSRTKT